MTDLQQRLEIPKAYLDSVNQILLDPNSEVMQKFLAVVAKYGTPEEINRKHVQSRRLENLLDLVAKKSPTAVDDLKWLMEQRDKGAFISEEGYRIQVLGDKAYDMQFKDECAVTLEVSALQYFPWVRVMAERAIKDQTLMPGRFIAVRKMK